MIVLVGESASGKSSIQNEFVKVYGYKRILEYTTRPKRTNEISGVDYHFINEEEFVQLKESDYFVATTCYNNWYYGIALKDCILENKNKIIVTNPSALRQIEKAAIKNDKIDITSFYIKVPRRDRLIKILERNDDVDEAIRRNMSDVGQFNGIEDEVDYILTNDGFQFSISDMAKKVNDLYK